ncbi:MAG: ABC transporter substrate-binding protein [Oligoflexales bacterium]|nr:ABC transporter substrate-binding protein [Oligoflexales bacterium]
MKKFNIYSIFCSCICVLFLTSPLSAASEASGKQKVEKPKKKVFISQVVDHPALNATARGIVDALAAAGYKKNENLDLRIESAQAQLPLSAQIASRFMSQKPDVVVAIGTLSAQSFAKQARAGEVKLIFSSVTDPLGAKLVRSLEKPEYNTSGVSNFVELKPQLSLFKEIQPKLLKVGVLYSSGELNSVSVVHKLEAEATALGLQLIKQTASRTADVAQAASKLAQQVGAIFISNDNTALSGFQSVVRAAQQAHIPVYVSDSDAVELGAVAALGPNQYAIGLQTGRMVVRVLEGADVNREAVEFPEKTELYLNPKAAQKADLSFSKELLNRATKVLL